MSTPFETLLNDLVPGSGRTDANSLEAPPFPTSLGLEPLGVIGKGGVGWVYRARDPVLDREVAVKISRPDGGESARKALLREARVTASLQHPAVLPVHRVLAADGLLCVEFRLAPATTLAARLADAQDPNDPSWPLVGRTIIVRVLADALAAAHGKGVVHGDLHPGNVALDEDDKPYLMDWGGDPSTPGHLTGHPRYASPEQLHGERPGPPSDIYSLGAVAWELCTLRPFRTRRPEEDLGTFIARWREAGVVPPSELAPVQQHLEALILEALRTDPAERPDAASLVAALDAVLTGSAEQARREAIAAELVHKARQALATFREQEKRKLTEKQVATVFAAKIPGHAPIEQKRQLWDAEDRVTHAERASEIAWIEAAEAATIADTLVETEETRDLRTECWWERLRVVETTYRDPGWLVMAKHQILAHDRGHYTRVLQSPSHVSLQASVPGARVTIAHFVARDRRLFPEVVEEHALPLEHHPLAPGSWLLTVSAPGYAEVSYPVLLDRFEHHEGTVNLYTPEQVGERWRYVPAGSFVMGDDEKAHQALDRCTPFVGDRFMLATCVTSAEWLEYLNALPPEEARARAPGEGGPFGGFNCCWELEDGVWRIPEEWDPDWPVMAINERDAEAYAAWLSERLGVRARLPTEEEWEKAARGADGRAFPWGDGFDPTYAYMRHSVPEAPHPAPVGTYPIDCSVYGLLDMAGCMREWTTSLFDTGARVLRGGCWGDDPDDLRCAARIGLREEFRISFVGFRLVREDPLPT